MSTRLFAVCAAALLVSFAFAGCNSTVPADDNLPPVPEASNDPSGLTGSSEFSQVGGQTGEWAPGANEKSTANVDEDGWVQALDANGNPLTFPTIYFAYDSDVLVPSESANLARIADYMLKNASLGVVIEGHCDQRGTEEYNRALGERRANVLRAFLAERGIADSRMKTKSFGKDKPAVEGSGESVWRQNRRGEFLPKLMPGN